MNWKDLKVSDDTTHFLFENKPVFGKTFTEVLKFHAPGLAPVRDISGAYHIDTKGDELYSHRYSRTFGFYCNRAAVIDENRWFHINEKGDKVYSASYLWVGNFQENGCTVRNDNNQYFHIDLNGKRMYDEHYIYAGDFKDGVACVKSKDGLFRHIDQKGNFFHGKAFLDLGVYHKNFATAKDIEGWFHIDKNGEELYPQRYLFVEPFYNGFALATLFDNSKQILDEKGKLVCVV